MDNNFPLAQYNLHIRIPPAESAAKERQVCKVPSAEGAQGAPPEQQPREASLDVEVTQSEREPHDHLPGSKDIIGTVNSAGRSAGT